MTHRGIRSKTAQLFREQRHEAREYVWKYSFYDTMKAETANTLTREQVIDHLTKTFPDVELYMYSVSTEQGEILEDMYGRGSFQLQPPQPRNMGR